MLLLLLGPADFGSPLIGLLKHGAKGGHKNIKISAFFGTRLREIGVRPKEEGIVESSVRACSSTYVCMNVPIVPYSMMMTTMMMMRVMGNDGDDEDSLLFVVAK